MGLDLVRAVELHLTSRDHFFCYTPLFNKHLLKMKQNVTPVSPNVNNLHRREGSGGKSMGIVDVRVHHLQGACAPCACCMCKLM